MSQSPKRTEISGPFDEPPSKTIVDEFRAHLAATRTPETFELLSHSKPPLGCDWKILHRFSIALVDRPSGTYIPCAFCQTREKFLYGALIWSADGHIRIVGNRCARIHFGEAAARDAYKEYDEYKIASISEDFFLDNLGVVRSLLSEAERLKEKAKQLETLKRDISRVAPTLFSNLTSAARSSAGSLTVVRKNSSNVVNLWLSAAGGNKSEFTEEAISFVVGFSLFQSDRRWMRKLTEITQELALIPQSPEALFDTLTNLTNAEKIALANKIRWAAKRIMGLFEELQLGNTFICEENAVSIRRWLKEAGLIDQIHVNLHGPAMMVSEHGHGQMAIHIAQNVPAPLPAVAHKITKGSA